MELPFEPVPDGCTILAAFAGVKALDEEGRVCWFSRYSPDLSNQEAIGMMEVMISRLVQECNEAFLKDDDDG